MKRKYERALNELLNIFKNKHTLVATAITCPALVEHRGDFEYLAAKGCVELSKDISTNAILFSKLTNSGITYFDDKAEKRATFIKDFFSQFLVGFLVGVCVGLAVPYLIKRIGI